MPKLSQHVIDNIKMLKKSRVLQRRAVAILTIMSHQDCSVEKACTIYEQKVRDLFGSVSHEVLADLSIIKDRREGIARVPLIISGGEN